MLKTTKMDLVNKIFDNTVFVINHVDHKISMTSGVANACKKELYTKPSIVNTPWYLISGVDTVYDPRLKERIIRLLDIFLQSEDYAWYRCRSTISKSCIRKIAYGIFKHVHLCSLHKMAYDGCNVKWTSMRVQYELVASLDCHNITELNEDKEENSLYCTLTTSYYRMSLNNMPVLLGFLMTAIQLGALTQDDIATLAHNHSFALLYQVYKEHISSDDAAEINMYAESQAEEPQLNKSLVHDIPIQASLRLNLKSANDILNQWVEDTITAKQIERCGAKKQINNKTYMDNPLTFINEIINKRQKQ